MAIRKHLPACLLYLGLALLVTYPLWIEPSSRIQSLGDPLLNSYILWWDHYALFHQITEFFQANVFWPHADALAYGEHLLAPAILALPFWLFTSSAVAVHNFSLIQAYFFCALAAHALAFHYFRNLSSATVAGIAYGFASYRIVQMGHIQLAHGEFLPLVILGFEKALRDDRRRWKWLMGASALGQWLTSWYWAIFSFWCLVPFFARRLWQSRRELSGKKVLGFAMPFLIAACVVIPVALPYLRLKMNHVFYRPKEVTLMGSADLSHFLRPYGQHPLFLRGGHFHYGAKFGFASEKDLFPGFPAALGLFVTLILSVRKTAVGNDEIIFPRRLWLGLTGLLFLFCLGPQFTWWADDHGDRTPYTLALPYALVDAYFPFAGGIRVPARWMLPALLGISMSLGFVCDLAVRNLNSFQPWVVGFAGCGLFLVDSYMGGPLGASPWFATVSVQPFGESMVSLHGKGAMMILPSQPPEVFTWLAEQRFPSPLVEIPLLPDDDNLPMLHATWHHQPTMNGTNGFFPPGHRADLKVIANFPSVESLRLLKEKQIRFVILDLAQISPQSLAMIASQFRMQHFGQFALVDLAP